LLSLFRKTLHLSEERILYLKELSKKDAIYERLASALAPSIYENMDIKKGILLQLFSGSNKDFDNAGRGKFRSVAVGFYFELWFSASNCGPKV